MVEQWLPYLFDTYRPRLVFFQAGVDALKEDSFGRLDMSRAGMLKRNHLVYSQCLSRVSAVTDASHLGITHRFVVCYHWTC